ncbi:prepilin-type N-terminal cleavage/methylation domain-containing protein [Gimesia sp.]|uniref:prepilin-type N-terminal cleavage/methylation domain-containing protein n=1 Tax=Gimesia sp. TaxID=2024833 RepID=UPI003A8FC7AE
MKRRPPITLSASKYSRRAFTLIELMIVIVIILILLGLIIPAIGSVRLRAQQAQVRAEIGNLEASITAFKADFGMDPPSGIILYESGSASWDQRSKGLIRQLWPQYNFSLSCDINGDGDTSDTILLNAGECLVFFLGGVYEKTSDGKFRVYGFSKNPARPFLNPGHALGDPGYSAGDGLSATNSGRQGPFFEFDISRFVDTDGDNAPEYLDSFPSQQVPYVYLSSYGGRGYRSGEYNTILTDIYRLGDPATTPPTSDPPYKPKSFQIISPGADYQLGTGGNYTPGKNLPGNRSVEADNITNFVSGSLQ